MSEWQPIETAPKDGHDVLVARWAAGQWEYAVAWWRDTGDGYPWVVDYTEPYPPDHFDWWMPIKRPPMPWNPEPPKADGA